MSHPTLEIRTQGRGGGLTYREGEHLHTLSWEFALDPALALIFGTPGERWDSLHPWAAGRQGAIYSFIGEEVVRRQAPSGDFELDLATGVITILRARRGSAGGGTGHSTGDATLPRPKARPRATSRERSADDTTAAWGRFTSSIAAVVAANDPSLGYDVAAIAEFTDEERVAAAGLLARRGGVGWREVEALEALATPEALAMLRDALRDHLSIRTRLAAAKALHARGGLPEIDEILADQLRALHDPRDGLAEALALAQAYPTAGVKQALLWASYNRTPCAPACARLLLRLAGAIDAAADAPTDATTTRMLDELGVHNSSFTRQAAFDALCARLGMTPEW